MSTPLSELPLPPTQLDPRPHPKQRVEHPLPVDLPSRPVAPERPVTGTPLPTAAPLRPRPPTPPVETPMPEPSVLGSLPHTPLDLPPAPLEPLGRRHPQTDHDIPPLDLSDDSVQATDEDLQEALFPLVESAVGRSLYSPDTGIHSYLEPLLRTTVRRALAELEGPEQAFGSVGLLDRMVWRLQALCTSRTYDEIVFNKTARHRIEDVLLLGREALDLISYASSDPGCHASPRRIQPLLREILPRLRDPEGALNLNFELAEDRSGSVREGRFTYLVVVVRGILDEFAFADLDFVHRRIEERYGFRLHDPSAPLLHRIQPMLEDCLLVRSPASHL